MPRLALVAASMVLAGGAGAAYAQSVRVSPTLDTELTWTDNVNAERNGREDMILEVSPGISVSRTGGRMTGGLSARFRNLMYARESDQNTSYLSLNGTGTYEAIEDLLFIDVAAGISRSNLSAFSGRGPGDPFGVDEDNETRTWSISPRLESDLRFGEAGRGSIRYSSRGFSSNEGGLGDQSVSKWDVSLSDPGGFRFFGWGVDYSRTDTDGGTSTSRSSTEETVRGTLFANVSPQFRVRGIVGHESNDYENGRENSGNIVGGGIDWYPTDRTAISATVEDRIFGRGYDVSFSHRMRRSVWSFGASRDISSVAQDLGPALVFEQSCVDLVSDPSFRPDITDPVLRQFLLLDCLSLTLLRSNAAFVDRSIRGGVSLLGVRNTLSFSATRSDRSRLSALSGLLPDDDFLTSDRIRLTTATVSWNHTLTGTSDLFADLTRSRSESIDDSQLDTRRLTATIGVSRTLGPYTRGSLRYRHEKADGSNDYTENSVTATLGMRF
ncbi:MAG: TIGR03016 family PEP-CTERM system-associated outer membrane protein [Thauera sp.]|nr:TIGR03016 family PEP-CTERM system-associated outer membrane protein [Thauera sp.]